MKSLKTLFENEEYDKVISEATKHLDDGNSIVYARIICMAYIKDYDNEGLDKFLASYLEAHPENKENLQFERAYADFMAKRDASWFLQTNCKHPRAAILRSEIQYRKLNFYDAANELIKYKPNQLNTITNMLAFASRSNSNVNPEYLKVDDASYEYYYNLSQYEFNHCNFQLAYEHVIKAQEAFDAQDEEDKMESDRLNLRLLSFITQSYCGKDPQYYCSEEPEQIQPQLQILDQVKTLKFERSDYQTLTTAISDLKSAETFLKGYSLPPQQM